MSIGLTQSATVYTEDPSTGAFTVTARSNLACRLFHVPRQPAATSAERAELGAIRNLHYDPAYTLPEGCQIEVDGVRWNVMTGTEGDVKPFGAVIQRRADLVQAGT